MGGVALEGLDEVGVGGVEVLVLGVEHAGLHVEACLEERGGVDGGGGGACGCEGGAGFGLVAEGVVDAGFEELDLDEDEFVVEAFELLEEGVDEGEGVVVGVFGHVEGDEAGFEGLAEEGAAFGDGPGDAGFGGADLDVGCVGDGGEEVEELADQFGGFGFGEGGQGGGGGLDEGGEFVGFGVRAVGLAQADERGFIFAEGCFGRAGFLREDAFVDGFCCEGILLR